MGAVLGTTNANQQPSISNTINVTKNKPTQATQNRKNKSLTGKPGNSPNIETSKIKGGYKKKRKTHARRATHKRRK